MSDPNDRRSPPLYFPRYWRRERAMAKGGILSGEATTDAWGWSDESPEAAARCARERAEGVLARLARDEDIPRDRTYYPGRPLREPVLEELRDGAGTLVGVLSRNAYGATVLNATRLFIADVDTPEPGTLRTWANRLLGKAPEDPVGAALDRTRAFAASHPAWTLRAYRTPAGLRVIATHEPMEARAPAVAAAFEALGADPLYRTLCDTHGTYRARLTAKPWRIGLPNPPAWPPQDAIEERALDAWLRDYETRARDRAACDLVATFGGGDVHDDLRPLLELHDARAGVGSGKPLA